MRIRLVNTEDADDTEKSQADRGGIVFVVSGVFRLVGVVQGNDIHCSPNWPMSRRSSFSRLPVVAEV